MSAMAEKLKDAGVDTIGARLTAACTDAIRRYPDSAVNAWRTVGDAFGHEFIRGLMRDMQAAARPKEPQQVAAEQYRETINRVNRSTDREIAAPYKPGVIPPERLERRRELGRIVQSKFKNSSNVAWSDVGWHELTSLKRDGAEAVALLAAAPAHIPNDGRSVGDVLGVKRVNEIIAEVRGRAP